MATWKQAIGNNNNIQHQTYVNDIFKKSICKGSLVMLRKQITNPDDKSWLEKLLDTWLLSLITNKTVGLYIAFQMQLE